VVVKVVASFIAAIVPIAGMWKVSAAAPTSTGLPDESLKVTKNSSPPCLSCPEELESVTVRLPAGALLMTLPVSADLVPQAAAKSKRAARLRAKIDLYIVFDPHLAIETRVPGP